MDPEGLEVGVEVGFVLLAVLVVIASVAVRRISDREDPRIAEWEAELEAGMRPEGEPPPFLGRWGESGWVCNKHGTRWCRECWPPGDPDSPITPNDSAGAEV